MAERRKAFLNPARSKALSRVFLNVFQLLVVGMFLSDAFARLAANLRVLAFVTMAVSFLAGVWLATEDGKEDS